MDREGGFGPPFNGFKARWLTLRLLSNVSLLYHILDFCQEAISWSVRAGLNRRSVRWQRTALPTQLRTHGATGGDRTHGLSLTKGLLCLPSYYSMERIEGLGPSTSCLEDRRSTTELHPHGASSRLRPDDLALTKGLLYQLSYRSMEPMGGHDPPTSRLQGGCSTS